MGTVPTSVPEIFLGANWLLEMDFKRKWSQVKYSKIFWIVISIFIIHFPCLIYTENLDLGLTDIKIKWPIFSMALILFTSKPLSLKELQTILICFLMGCLTNTAWCLTYTYILHSAEHIRNVSRYMSHIRLGLYLNVAIFTSIYLSYKFVYLTPNNYRDKILFGLIAVYLTFVLIILGLVSGLIIFLILSFLTLVVLIYRQNSRVKLISYGLIGLCLVSFIFYLNNVRIAQLVVNNSENNKVQKQNSVGRTYIHFDTLGQRENGNYVLINIQLDELQREWKRQVPADSFNFEKQHNLNRYEILTRYLASKGLNKDSVGISKLSPQDKINIQKNITNYLYADWGYLQKRTYELLNEYTEYSNNRQVNGHSLTMRLYFWKASLQAISNNFWFGVGTGDVQEVLDKTYIETQSPLKKEWYKRPHNQFLTVFLSVGIFGFLIFLLSVFYPVFYLRKELDFLFWVFFLVLVYSFLFEDTLETQAGSTFYAFFYCLFISQAWFRKKQIPEDLQANR